MKISLTKIALATAVIGMIALIFLSQNLEPKQIPISKISSDMIDEHVKVSGEVSKIKYSKTTSFTISDGPSDSDSIYAFSFEKLDLTEGDYEIIGKVNEYYGVLEIEVEKIKPL